MGWPGFRVLVFLDDIVEMGVKRTGRYVEPRHEGMIDEQVLRLEVFGNQVPGGCRDVDLIDVKLVVRIRRSKRRTEDVLDRRAIGGQVHCCDAWDSVAAPKELYQSRRPPMFVLNFGWGLSSASPKEGGKRSGPVVIEKRRLTLRSNSAG